MRTSATGHLPGPSRIVWTNSRRTTRSIPRVRQTAGCETPSASLDQRLDECIRIGRCPTTLLALVGQRGSPAIAGIRGGQVPSRGCRPRRSGWGRFRLREPCRCSRWTRCFTRRRFSCRLVTSSASSTRTRRRVRWVVAGALHHPRSRTRSASGRPPLVCLDQDLVTRRPTACEPAFLRITCSSVSGAAARTRRR